MSSVIQSHTWDQKQTREERSFMPPDDTDSNAWGFPWCAVLFSFGDWKVRQSKQFWKFLDFVFHLFFFKCVNFLCNELEVFFLFSAPMTALGSSSFFKADYPLFLLVLVFFWELQDLTMKCNEEEKSLSTDAFSKVSLTNLRRPAVPDLSTDLGMNIFKKVSERKLHFNLPMMQHLSVLLSSRWSSLLGLYIHEVCFEYIFMPYVRLPSLFIGVDSVCYYIGFYMQILNIMLKSLFK